MKPNDKVISVAIGILLFAFLQNNASCQTPIEVKDRSDGIVGQRLAYFVREEIRKSLAFELVAAYGNRLQIIICTIPKDENHPNDAAIYSIIWNFVKSNSDNTGEICIYLDNTLGYCGSDVVLDSAQFIVARTDKITQVIQNFVNTRNQ